MLDGTLAECDRVGDSRTDFSQKHRRHSVNVQVVADPAGNLLWISPALSGRTHDLHPPHHPDLRTPGRARPRQSCLHRRRPLGDHTNQTAPSQDLNPTQRTINRALSAARAPVERSVARLKPWRRPQSSLQSQPHDRHRRRRPHPGEATRKEPTATTENAAQDTSRHWSTRHAVAMS
ncbi:transposase family protein [Streptomyces tendae]|uniref:transposase family protein n=1 Tax=Streptomyces tendae TaxID=1932 RepID=UPI0036B6F337